jgi:hypothetical protein
LDSTPRKRGSPSALEGGTCPVFGPHCAPRARGAARQGLRARPRTPLGFGRASRRRILLRVFLRRYASSVLLALRGPRSVSGRQRGSRYVLYGRQRAVQRRPGASQARPGKRRRVDRRPALPAASACASVAESEDGRHARRNAATCFRAPSYGRVRVAGHFRAR